MKWISDVIDVMHDKRIIKLRPLRWRARLTVSLILLIFSTIGILFTSSSLQFAFRYWCIAIPIFAILCIWLSWYVSRTHEMMEGSTVWHEILHWLGLLLAVYVVSIFVSNSIITSLVGALFVSLLLALTLFLAGVHFDGMFLLLGILIGVLAVASVYFVKYITVIIIPAAVIVGLLLIWRFMIKRQGENENYD